MPNREDQFGVGTDWKARAEQLQADLARERKRAEKSADERDAALIQLAAARKDAERLDWIERQGDIIQIFVDAADMVGQERPVATANAFERRGIRAAIDAARSNI